MGGPTAKEEVVDTNQTYIELGEGRGVRPCAFLWTGIRSTIKPLSYTKAILLIKNKLKACNPPQFQPELRTDVLLCYLLRITRKSTATRLVGGDKQLLLF